MATAAEIDQLRGFVNEQDNEEPFTDELLGTLIDTLGVREAAADIWRRKAAGVADLVNVSENGSSRSMGSLYSQYLAMAKEFGDSPEEIASAAGPTFGRIRRA